VRIDRAASDPFTTHEVLAEMHETPLRGKRVVVQRYGETNRELQAALESKGAEVIEIVTYRWALPEDTAPLLRLIEALGRDEIDLVAFTSASQASNLFAVARHGGQEASLKQSLGRTLVASIGPVCSAALRKLAVRVDIEARPPKLGAFIDAINAALSDPRRWANPDAWGSHKKLRSWSRRRGHAEIEDHGGRTREKRRLQHRDDADRLIQRGSGQESRGT
jgi:uroporphyrinogen-III synthase